MLAFFSMHLEAAIPSTAPQFRIEGEMHNALIRVIRHNVKRNRMVTISYDKTIRIWQLPQWRLLKVIYVPSEVGYEGRLHALAVSPDGNTIAAAGWTGWDWDKSARVYLFDSQTGELKQSIRALKSVVSYMAYSADGGLLAVGLTDNQGLHFFETSTYKQVAEDLEYGGEVGFVEFSPKDRTLVSSSNDGYIRLYDQNQKLSIRQPLEISKHIGGIRISPNGRLLSFGLQDKPLALVLTIPEMKIVGRLTADEIAGQESLCCIAWSRDGKHIFANGRYEGKGETPIYRWDVGKFDNRKTIYAALQRVQSMFPMPDGSLIYATEDPSIGMINPTGKRIDLVAPVIANFKDGGDAFKVSEDGQEIMFPMARGGKLVSGFSVPKLKLNSYSAENTLSTSKTSAKDLFLAKRNSENFKLTNFENSETPKLNGKLLKTYPQEIFRSYAVTPDDSALLVGTDWSLRLLDKNGEVIWDKPGLGVAWNVNISKNGLYAIATYGDGTVRWHRITDGKEIISLFPHKNGHDWVLWRPDGYYASSENGDKYVGWLINRGKDKAADFYRAIQFERVFYRPDLVKNELQIQQAVASSNGEKLASVGDFSIDRINEILPSRITIEKSEPESNDEETWLNLKIKFENDKLVSNDFGVYVNGIPFLRNEERNLSNDARKTAYKTIKIPVNESDNEIRVEAFNGVSMGLAETFVNAKQPTAENKKKGNLYILSIGANHFTNFTKADNVDLDFAAQDAEELVKLIKTKSTTVFNNINVKTLSDFSEDKATKNNIISSLEFLKQANFNDTVILFLASHGFSDSSGNYYFLPRDANKQDVKQVLGIKKSSTQTYSSLVGWKDFFEALSKSAGRRIMIVDTCQAKGVAGTFDSHTLKKRSAAAQFALMVASQSDESSQEYPPAQHGLFTFSLIEGLKGKADEDQNGQVTMEELYQFSTYLVDKLRSEKQPQQPDLIAPIVLRETLLSKINNNDTQIESVPKLKSKSDVSFKKCKNEIKSRTLSFSGACK